MSDVAEADKVTHRCRVCGALWRLWAVGEAHPNSKGSWQLKSAKCGACCDNAPTNETLEMLGTQRKGNIHKTYLLVEVTHDEPLPEITDLIANRLWSMQHVTDVVVAKELSKKHST